MESPKVSNSGEQLPAIGLKGKGLSLAPSGTGAVESGWEVRN